MDSNLVALEDGQEAAVVLCICPPLNGTSGATHSLKPVDASSQRLIHPPIAARQYPEQLSCRRVPLN